MAKWLQQNPATFVAGIPSTSTWDKIYAIRAVFRFAPYASDWHDWSQLTNIRTGTTNGGRSHPQCIALFQSVRVTHTGNGKNCSRSDFPQTRWLRNVLSPTIWVGNTNNHTWCFSCMYVAKTILWHLIVDFWNKNRTTICWFALKADGRNRW